MPQAPVVISPAASPYLASSFSCTWEEGGSGAAWVRVAGELDLLTSPKLEQTLGEAQRYARLVALDLRELTFIDCAGVHVILDAQRAECRLVLVRGQAHVDRVLTLTGACEQVEIVDLDPSKAPLRALLDLAQERAAA
jgi:anti-anti-sigma factor